MASPTLLTATAHTLFDAPLLRNAQSSPTLNPLHSLPPDLPARMPELQPNHTSPFLHSFCMYAAND